MGINKITPHELEVLFWRYDRLTYKTIEDNGDISYLFDCGFEFDVSKNGWTALKFPDNLGIQLTWTGNCANEGIIYKCAEKKLKKAFVEMVNKGICVITAGIIPEKVEYLNWDNLEEE